MTPLPLTVISGYLGAGKTTLINRMLARPLGLKLMVMVNDFGAINIDQSLIAAQGRDVIALTNGCVCCTMGADLYMAFSDVLDRQPRPDHLIIEASGIADPKAIANVAIAEPDMRYAGIVTLVDALNIQTLLEDPLVGPQVAQQVRAADLVVLTKSQARDPALDSMFVNKGLQLPEIIDADAVSVLMLDRPVRPTDVQASPHPAYVSWDDQTGKMLDHKGLMQALAERPSGLYRLKGFVYTEQGAHEIHIVGKDINIRRMEDGIKPSVVGLGLHARVSRQEIAEWWNAIPTMQRAAS